MDDFAQQYLCEASTLEMPLDQRLAIYYHLQCEYFDRMVCSDRDAFGDAQPSSQMQRAEINRHAEWMIRQILHDYPDVDERYLRMQISKYGSRYTTKRLEEMYEHLSSRFVPRETSADRVPSDVPDVMHGFVEGDPLPALRSHLIRQ